MAKTERIELRASSAFIDRLEELASEMKVSKAEVIRTAIDMLEMLTKEDKEGREIMFVPKQQNQEKQEESGRTALSESADLGSNPNSTMFSFRKLCQSKVV